jgi:hypothetical protein
MNRTILGIEVNIINRSRDFRVKREVFRIDCFYDGIGELWFTRVVNNSTPWMKIKTNNSGYSGTVCRIYLLEFSRARGKRYIL